MWKVVKFAEKIVQSLKKNILCHNWKEKRRSTGGPWDAVRPMNGFNSQSFLVNDVSDENVE